MKIVGKLGEIEILSPGCNIDTITDSRGGIFTWVPKEPILEFNMVYLLPNKVRGNHRHPEFVEYFLVVEGSGVMVTVCRETGERLVHHAAKGTCFRTPKNVPHTFYPIGSATCMSFLTKPWDECDEPIEHHYLAPFDQEYVEHADREGWDIPEAGDE